MKIARVTLQDDLIAICAQLTPEKWGKDNEMKQYELEALQQFLAEAHNLLVLAWSGNSIVGVALGYVLMHPDGKEHSLYIHELDTHPDFRRQGIATKLIQWLREYASIHALQEVWLSTELEDNESANRFYRALLPDETLKSVIYSYNAQE